MYGENVYIRKSKICNGLGLFAKRNISEGSIITWYYGKLSNENMQDNKYAMDYDSIHDKKSLIGFSNIQEISYGKGLAQFANDAIYIELTGKNNNSHFIQRGRYILLIANEDIEKNDEILASYGIDYWIHEININFQEYNEEFKNIINILNYIIKTINKFCKCDINECKKIEEDFKINEYKLSFNLYKNKRWCMNINNWHNDNNFYIITKKVENSTKIYYICITCELQNSIFLIDIS